jgi:hypothetical protein
MRHEGRASLYRTLSFIPSVSIAPHLGGCDESRTDRAGMVSENRVGAVVGAADLRRCADCEKHILPGGEIETLSPAPSNLPQPGLTDSALLTFSKSFGGEPCAR